MSTLDEKLDNMIDDFGHEAVNGANRNRSVPKLRRAIKQELLEDLKKQSMTTHEAGLVYMDNTRIVLLSSIEELLK